MSVARMHAAPVVDDNIRTKRADDPNHVFKNGVAPDLFGLFRCLRKAEVEGTCEIKRFTPYPRVAASNSCVRISPSCGACLGQVRFVLLRPG